VVDERAVIMKAYCKSRNQLIIEDNKWIRQMITEQEKALKLLKEISPSLYDEAIKPDAAFLPYSFQGPVLTAPIKNYRPPDGDYTDTTPTYEKVVKK
jgi:large subunit ribosomal protein L40